MRAPLHASVRSAVLARLADLVAADADALAGILAAEAGKPLSAAHVEVARAVRTARLASEEARRLTGESVALTGIASSPGHHAMTLRVPIGVVAAITPFNFPLNLAMHKVAPAIAAGCAVVLKPAEKTPLTGCGWRSCSWRPGFQTGGSRSWSGRRNRSPTSSARTLAWR